MVVYGINAGYTSSKRQGLIFLLFGSFMAFGAVYSWAYLPDVQRWTDDGSGRRRKLENKNLEDLGEGRDRARAEGEVITIKDKWREIRRRGRRPSVPVASGPSRMS